MFCCIHIPFTTCIFDYHTGSNDVASMMQSLLLKRSERRRLFRAFANTRTWSLTQVEMLGLLFTIISMSSTLISRVVEFVSDVSIPTVLQGHQIAASHQGYPILMAKVRSVIEHSYRNLP